MTLETYLQACVAFQIYRGQLQDGFSDHVTVANTEPFLINPNAPATLTPPPITEDLSRFWGSRTRQQDMRTWFQKLSPEQQEAHRLRCRENGKMARAKQYMVH